MRGMEATRVIRVLIGDDDATFRDALSDVLDDDPRFEVAGVAPDGVGLVDLASRIDADVALVDVRMPAGGVCATAALSDVHAAWAPITVIAISADTAASTVVAIARAGARGYLAKGNLGADLPDLVARCVAGETVLAVPSATEVLRQLGDDGF